MYIHICIVKEEIICFTGCRHACRLCCFPTSQAHTKGKIRLYALVLQFNICSPYDSQKLASYLGLNWYSLSDEGPCHSDELFVQFKFHVVPFDCRYRWVLF